MPGGPESSAALKYDPESSLPQGSTRKYIQGQIINILDVMLIKYKKT